MKPLSDLDINRRVDFELLKRNMSRDQHIKNQESLSRNLEMSVLNSESIEEKIEDKKILMLMYESKERVYFPGQMVKKETANEVMKLMESVMESEHGTGRKLKIAGYRLAGKTGTAQKIGTAK